MISAVSVISRPQQIFLAVRPQSHQTLILFSCLQPLGGRVPFDFVFVFLVYFVLRMTLILD